MTDNATTDNSATGTATLLQVLYAGCLDSDPYFCLKQCDQVVVSELRERGVEVRELHKKLPKGKIFRKLNRHLFYPVLVARATRDQRLAISRQPSSDLRPLFSRILHIGNQCYAHLIPAAQRLKPNAQRLTPNAQRPTPNAQRLISITVHDLAEHYFPQDLTKAQMFRWQRRIVQLKQADLIFSVSQHTKDDLMRLLNIPEQKIIVNYNGVDSAFRKLSEGELPEMLKALGIRHQAFGGVLDSRAFGTRFTVLAVGADLYRKNLSTLVKAVDELARRGVPVTLIKVGDPIPQHLTPNTQPPASNAQNLTPNAQPPAPNAQHLTPNAQCLEIINLGHISQTELISLYNLCDVLAFPSLYEGFGMPVIEAQCCGLPCVISNAASLPEIGGEGALYHDPLDIGGLSDQLQRVYEEEPLRNELREKGFKNAERFSWERHVDILMEGFEKIFTEV